MPHQVPLKDRARRRLRVVASGYAFALAWFALGAPMSWASVVEIDLPKWLTGVLPGLVVLALGWIDRLGSPLIKEVLIFWRLKERLPGHRAWERSTFRSDTRINRKALKESLGKFPSAPAQQNATWYGLYTKHGEAPAVEAVHLDYLTFRELTWLAFVGAVVSILLAWREPVQRWALIRVAIGTVVAGVAASIAGRNAGHRFVTTVLALEAAGGASPKKNDAPAAG
jgi:hypothetical protein